MKVAVKKHTSKWESHWKGERCLLGWHSEPGLLFQWRLSLSSTKFPVNSGVGSDSLLMILEYVFVALTFNQCIWVSEVRTSFSGSLKLSSWRKHHVWPDLKLAWGCSLKSWTPQIYNTFQEGGFFFSLSPFFWWFDKYDKDVLPLEGEMLEEDFGKRQVSAPTLVLPVLSLHPDPCYHVRDWLSQPRCCSAASGQGQMFGLEQSTWHTEIYKSLKRSCLHAQPLQSCLALCDPMNCSPPQAPLSMGFSRQEYWRGLPCPPPGDLPSPGIKPGSPELPVDSLLLSHWVIFLIRVPSQPQVVIRTPTCKSLQIAHHLSIFSVQDSKSSFA